MLVDATNLCSISHEVFFLCLLKHFFLLFPNYTFVAAITLDTHCSIIIFYLTFCTLGQYWPFIVSILSGSSCTLQLISSSPCHL